MMRKLRKDDEGKFISTPMEELEQDLASSRRETRGHGNKPYQGDGSGYLRYAATGHILRDRAIERRKID
ncbi:MAG: hypothetical protein FWH02_03255 [Oscillospiraceae bacterium]|nr:hypothetical protein [Oscillospiraceae bacterium]